GQAQTGTGKTAAFLLSIYARFVSDHKDAGQRGDVCRPKALILAPTRELVVQIARDAEGLGKYVPFRCLALYGGMDYERQQKKLRETNYDLIAATPGRLLDFSNQGLLSFAETKILVLDEADRMLDMGFIPDVRRIIRKLPPREKRQTMLFSATLSPDVLRLASNWMTDPEVIEIEPESVAVDTVEQRIYLVSSDDKLKVLYNLLKS
ncbi:MAG: DEAD/DEAH box helicase, partial [Nitrospinaceae bacterium]|nr:DEAD/DEAH box helicase [Nitrospinaceae bacterium]